MTKNVSVMWKEYADSIGVGVQSLTKEQKILAEVNGILRETRFQTGDAAKAAGTYAGQVAMLSFNFQQLKVAVGNAIMPLVKAVLPGVNTIILALTKLANVFAQVTSLLFGKDAAFTQQAGAQRELAASGGAASDAAKALGKSTEGAGKSAKKAARDMQGVLAGFDDLNVLASRAADSVDGAASDLGGMGVESPELPAGQAGGELFGNVTVNPEIEAFVDRLKIALEPTIEALGRLWAELQRLGGFAWQGLVGFYDSFLRPIGEWAMGEDGLPRFIGLVADTLANIDWGKLVDSFNGLWEQLARVATFTGDALIDFLEYFLKPLEEWRLNEAIPRLVDALTNGLAQVNWEVIRQGLIELWKALEPFAEHVGEGLLWFWENVLVPLGTWVMNEVVPRFLTILAEAIGVVNGIIERVKPAFDWLWKNFLQPIGEWAGDIFITALDIIIDLFSGLSDLLNGDIKSAFGHFGDAINHVKELFGLLYEAAFFHLKLIKDSFFGAVAWFRENVIQPLGEVFSALWESVSGFAKGAWDAISKLWSTVSEWFNKNIIQPVGKFFSGLWGGVKQAAKAAWDGIVSIWKTVSGWFNANIIQPVSRVFGELWRSVSTWASNAWNGITGVFGRAAEWFHSTIITPVTSGFKGFFNGLINFAEGFVNFFIRGINRIIDGINSLHFELPDFLGGGRVGFNIRSVRELNLPRLGNGAVIPPNRQFAAVLGDQRSGVNIETPLATMVEAFKSALAEGGYAGGELTVTMPVYLDSREIYRGQQKVSLQRGKNLVGGLT